MFCANCYKEIPAGKAYYKHRDTNQSFCTLQKERTHLLKRAVVPLGNIEHSQ